MPFFGNIHDDVNLIGQENIHWVIGTYQLSYKVTEGGGKIVMVCPTVILQKILAMPLKLCYWINKWAFIFDKRQEVG